jgi:hypothetical protein
MLMSHDRSACLLPPPPIFIYVSCSALVLSLQLVSRSFILLLAFAGTTATMWKHEDGPWWIQKSFMGMTNVPGSVGPNWDKKYFGRTVSVWMLVINVGSNYLF